MATSDASTISATLSRSQTDDLRSYGLSTRQISAIETTVRNFKTGGYFGAAPTMADVKRPIADASKSLRYAARRLQGFLGQARGGCDQAARDAGNAVYAAASLQGIGSDELDVRIRSVAEIAEFCDLALSQLPIQKRSNHAHWLPVARIWEAINRAHQPGQESQRLSSSPGSAFRKICGVCYEVMTDNPEADPERALKSFVALKRRQLAKTRAERRSSIKVESVRTRGSKKR